MLCHHSLCKLSLKMLKINLSLQSNLFFVGIEAADLTSLLEQFEETQGNH